MPDEPETPETPETPEEPAGRLAPYLSVEEYTAMVSLEDVLSQEEATVLAGDLAAASRILDGKCGLAPGALSPADEARYVSGDGGRILWIADDEGVHLLRSVSAAGIAVDTNGDGEAEVTCDPEVDAWVVPLPRNSSSGAWHALELLPRPGALLSAWPRGRWNIRITSAEWGMEPIADDIKRAVQDITRALRDRRAGGTGDAYRAAGGELPLVDHTWRVIADIRRQHSYRPGARVLR